MKYYYILLVILVIAGCNNANGNDGLVNFPDDITGDFVVPGDDVTDTTFETSTTEEMVTNEVTTTKDMTTKGVTSTTIVTTTKVVTTTQTDLKPTDETLITINEGDLLKLNLKATDPDNNPIQYSYTEPLNADGEWQTTVGDAGEYLATVTASDGELSTTKKLRIMVMSNNKMPVITNFDSIKEIVVYEGDTVRIEPEITDEEGDNVDVSYSGFMTTNTYVTNYNDAGTYTVKLNLDDGTNKVTKDISVVIKNSNRAPVLQALSDLSVIEGETVRIEAGAEDPDQDDVTLSFEYPLDSKGTWQTKIGDAGEYQTTVTATDGDLEDSETISITVLPENEKPVISNFVNINVKEGDLITLSPTVTDADGDEVSLQYSGWMQSNSYQTTFDDEGSHTVTLTASDNKESVTKTITITVKNVNRAPSGLDIEVIIVPGGN